MCSTCCMERTLNKCRNILKMIWVIRLCIQFIFYAACYYVIYQNISAEIAGCFIAILSLRQHSWRPYRSCLFVLNNESHTVNILNFGKYFWYFYTLKFVFNDSSFLISTCRITTYLSIVKCINGIDTYVISRGKSTWMSIFISSDLKL